MAKQCPGCPDLYNWHSLLPWERITTESSLGLKPDYKDEGWEFCPKCKKEMVGHLKPKKLEGAIDAR